MYEITMPKLSDSMEVGKIIEWKVSEGDEVDEGDVLAEVESDKAVMELECFQAGVLSKIVKPNESEVAVGEVIGLIGEAAEAGGGVKGKGRGEEEEEEETPEARPEPTAPEPAARPAAEGKKKEAKPAEKRAPKPAPSTLPLSPSARVRVSPYAARLAAERGVDVAALKGSGPGGRIVARDIPGAAAAPKAVTAAPPSVSPSPDEELPPLQPRPEEADVQDAPFRLKTQARYVTASKHVVPHFYISRSVDITRLLARKADYKAKTGATLTHILMAAVVEAVRRHPNVNRSYDRGKIIDWKMTNIGIAVDTDAGLTVAVVRDAASLSFPDLVSRSSELVEKARASKLSPEERRYPTFTITNLGMLDVENFIPIINPPSSMILAVATAMDQVVVRDGLLQVGKLMNLTLSCDHRIIEGAAAARFLKELRGLLESPDDLLGLCGV
jgi:pyruvate dehydrogenase E2 component (dihydrolipoamide acetyltransferase)